MNNIFQSLIEVKGRLPKGKGITLVGGCFDLIHVGHVHLLEHAATLDDLLVVAILSDSYAKKYKDSSRPIINQKQRARMVASIRCVDFVYISETSPSSVETLQTLQPNNVVFDNTAANSEKMQRRIQNMAESSPQTKIHFLNRYNEEDISTSHIIDKIREG